MDDRQTMTMPAEPPAGEGLYKSAVFLLSLGTEVAARVLSQMDDRHVERLIAELLASLPADIQGPVAARLTELETPAPIALEHLERCLVAKLQGDPSSVEVQSDAGPRRVADILGRMRRSMENLVLASLEQQSPVLAQKVNRFRFTIENLLELEGRSLQRVLRDVEVDTLRLAMKGLDEEQQQTIFSNMSERASARLREDLENSGPTQLR